MASYELWMNGQQYDSIFYDGHEYTEAWTSINGVPTLVWKKGGGLLAGGFYDANDNQLLDWFTVYDGQFTSTGRQVQFNLPNWTSTQTARNYCTNLPSTMGNLGNLSTPSITEDVVKIVVPSEVTNYNISTSLGVFHGEDSPCQKVKEIVFNEVGSPVTFSGSSSYPIITNCRYLEKVVFPAQSTINQRILEECGTETSEGTEIDLSKTLMTKLASSSFYEAKIKSLKLPETLTSYEKDLFAYSNLNGKLYMPNVKEYPSLGRKSTISEIEIPENSTLKISFATSGMTINNITINNGATLEPALSNCTVNNIKFVGNDFTFFDEAIYMYDKSPNLNIIFDDSMEEFKRSASSNPNEPLFYFGKVTGLNIHFPLNLKKIAFFDFYFYGYGEYKIKPLDIPSSVEIIEEGAFRNSFGEFTDKIVIRNPNITVGNNAFPSSLVENCTLYFDGTQNPNTWIDGYSSDPTLKWKEILPVSAYEG